MEKLKRMFVFQELKIFFNEFLLISSLSGKLFFIASTTGIVVGFAIILFNFILEAAIIFFEYLISILPFPSLIIFIPAFGGLLAGLIRWFSKTSFAYGCGTDAAIETIHKKNGHIKKIIPIAGILSSSMTIASGGSCGREGPASSIGAGFASITVYLIRRLKLDSFFGITLTKHDERIMAICGAAAGVAAIFRAPIGAAIFSTEVLYSYGFEFTALFPALLSSIIGFTLFSAFYSYEPLFKMDVIWSFGFSTIIFAIILSVISSILGWFYVHIFNSVFHVSRKLKFPDWIKPAIGGLFHGLLIYFVAKELWGMGYDTIQNTIDGRLSITLMCILLFGKIFSTSFTIASGGSGGLIAPSLFIGAMLGGILGKSLGLIFTTSTPVGVYVVIGMGALFSAVGKVPFALPLLIMEATRNISLMLPLFIASTIGYILSGKSTLYDTQPLRIDFSEIGINVLGETEGSFVEKYEVRDIMIKNDSAIPYNANLKSIIKFIQENKEPFYPVVDKSHKYIGIISLSKIKYIFSNESINQLILASDLAVEGYSFISANTNLKEALKLFHNNNLDYISVIDNEESRKFVGILPKSKVMRLLKVEMLKKVSKIGLFGRQKKKINVKNIEINPPNSEKMIYRFLEKKIELDIKAKKKNGAILEMVTSLYNVGRVNNVQNVTDFFMAREAGVTTGIGGGIAFPHIRTDLVSQEILIFGRSIDGIQYDSIDKKPVHFIFMILTPLKDGESMLKILSSLSKILKNEEFLTLLMRANNSKIVEDLLHKWELKENLA